METLQDGVTNPLLDAPIFRRLMLSFAASEETTSLGVLLPHLLGEIFKWMQLFDLQLEASHLQWSCLLTVVFGSFFTYHLSVCTYNFSFLTYN